MFVSSQSKKKKIHAMSLNKTNQGNLLVLDFFQGISRKEIKTCFSSFCGLWTHNFFQFITNFQQDINYIFCHQCC